MFISSGRISQQRSKMVDSDAVIANGCFHDWFWNPRDKSPGVILSETGSQGRGTHLEFHPSWSVGTAAIRGDSPLRRDCGSYWEISLRPPIYGTSIMFGVGTGRARLHVSDAFVNLLGEDGESWGLSHKGRLWHDHIQREYISPFYANSKTIVVGLYFDGPAGTLTYFKDGASLGVAFEGLDRVESDLYPMVAVTGARIGMTLLETRRRSYANLQDRCGSRLAAILSTADQIKMLPVPHKLQEFIASHMGG